MMLSHITAEQLFDDEPPTHIIRHLLNQIDILRRNWQCNGQLPPQLSYFSDTHSISVRYRHDQSAHPGIGGTCFYLDVNTKGPCSFIWAIDADSVYSIGELIELKDGALANIRTLMMRFCLLIDEYINYHQKYNKRIKNFETSGDQHGDINQGESPL